MKNLKLYENFASSDLPDFGDALKEISPLFPQYLDKISDPKKYDLTRLGYDLKVAKTQQSRYELFKEIIKILKNKGYDYDSFPKTKGFDFERVERAYGGLDLTYESGRGMNLAICFPVNNQGQKQYFLLDIEDGKTLFVLFKKPNDTFLIDYKGSDRNRTLDLVFYVNGELHTGTFELDDVIPGNLRLEEDTYAVYYSTKSSDGKKYYFSTNIEYHAYEYDNVISIQNDNYILEEVTDKKTS
jgi:hypothetical protein